MTMKVTFQPGSDRCPLLTVYALNSHNLKKMEVKKLHKDLINKLRSTFTISNFTQCIMELVYNSLDANSTAVAIRINFVTYRIQVVDNGDGISKNNMSSIGIRYMTNRIEGIEDFKHQLKYYGYRGESLASITECSKSVNITSRYKKSFETYSKTLQKNGSDQINLTKTRPSNGTTVTVEGVFYSLTVRRNRIVSELELDDLKMFIQNIILMHPNVSFTIRDDVTSELLLNSHKHKDIIAAFNHFHPEIDCDFSLLKVSKNKLTIEALLFKDLYDNKNIQYIFVNKRPVRSTKIQKYVVSMISRNRRNVRNKIKNLNNMYPVYIVHIKCPYALVSFNTDQAKTTVEFADWSSVFRYIEKLVYTFFGNENKFKEQKKLPPPHPEDFMLECGPSQIYGAVKAYAYKRNSDEIICETMAEKVPKLQETHISDKILRHKTADSITEKLPQLYIENLVERNNEDIVNQIDEHHVAIESKTNKMCDKDLEDIYCISDTTPQQKPKMPFKKPLPIKISCKNQKQAVCLYSNISPSQQEAEKPQNVLQNKPIDERSTITGITNDEVKGKHLIMDMFLKSTQVFNSDGSTSDVKSEGTIFEVVSNMLLENNITSQEDGFTKTMSVSVNVKRKQTIKMRKRARSKISKCVQTTFRSKSVKSVKIKRVKNKAFEDVRDSRDAGEYTIIFSNIMNPNKEPKFKFIPCSSEFQGGDLSENNVDFDNLCLCRCHSIKDKLFSFSKENTQYFVCNVENTGDLDKLNHENNLKITGKIGPKHDSEENCNTHFYSKHDDVSHLRKYRSEKVKNDEHKQYNLHEYNHRRLIEDDYEKKMNGKVHEMRVHPVFHKCEVPVNNLEFEQGNKNLQQMYTYQIFDKTKYDKNILHPNEKMYSNHQILPEKGCCQHTNTDIQTYGCSQEHICKNNANVRYSCLNKFDHLNRDPYFSNYTNACAIPSYTNFVKHVPHVHSNEGTSGHAHTVKQNLQQPFPQLNVENVYRATKNYYESQVYSDKYNKPLKNSAIPKWIECVKTKKQKWHAISTESPYFKRPPIRTPNTFNFVEHLVPKVKRYLNVVTAESPYFTKRDRGIYMEKDQKLKLHENQEIDTYPFIEGQHVFHCGSEQTLAKNFDIQLFNLKTSGDLFRSDDSPGKGNNFTIASFNQFMPENLSTQIGGLTKAGEVNDKNIAPGLGLPDICDVPNHASKRSTHDVTNILPTASSELCITLSKNQNQNLLNEELRQDKMFDFKQFKEFSSQPMETNQNIYLEEGWIKEADKCGNVYYLNKKTGYATYNTPKQEANNGFKVSERHEFLPKGFSPMLVETEPVDRSLSQNKKDKLLEYIMETYQTDLMYIKWRNYMDDIDPNVFFHNLYKEKVKQYEESIPNVAILHARNKFRKDQIRFDKRLFPNIEIIGQIDKKFICALERDQNLLILFDQHAVHERVRLEKLLTDYKGSKCRCDEIVIFLPKSHSKLLVKHEAYINSLGLSMTYHTNGINVTEIPSYIYHKFKDNESGFLAKVIQLVIKEIVELLKSTRGSTSTCLPKCLQDIISLEACRGAVKFGDVLSKEQCTDLLTILSTCNLPFQCAHGRPTLVPLMHLEDVYARQKIHFKNIRGCEL